VAGDLTATPILEVQSVWGKAGPKESVKKLQAVLDDHFLGRCAACHVDQSRCGAFTYSTEWDGTTVRISCVYRSEILRLWGRYHALGRL